MQPKETSRIKKAEIKHSEDWLNSTLVKQKKGLQMSVKK